MANKMFEIAFQLAGKINSSFGGMFTSAHERMAQMNRSISSLKTEMKELDAVQKNVVRYRGLQEQVAQTGIKFEAARAEVNKLTAELSKAERPTRELKQQFREAKTQADSLKNKLASQQTELQRLESALSKAGAFTRNLANDNAKLAAQLEKAERAQQKLAKAINLQNRVSGFRSNMRGNMLDAAAMAVTLGAPAVAAMKFESSMADVRKVVDFDTPEQFKDMEKDILSLSKRIPMAADGLAQIVAAGGQAGIARDELTGYAEAAAKMGVAFDISAEEAGQTMAQWRSAFKMNQEQVNTLADQINYLGNTTAASAPKISEVVRRIGPLGDVGGAAASQIAALGATMVGAGVEEEIAATAIKNMILAMVAGESATKDQAEAFQALGMDAGKMASMMQKDAQGAITSVFKALQKLPKEKQASVLQNLFGKESIGAIAPLLTNLEGLQENFKKVGDSTQYAGSMQKEFEARSATTENKLQLLKNQASALAITTGSVLLPPLASLAEKLSGVAERVAAFSEKHPGLTKVMVIAAAGALGLGIAVTALGYAASLIASPFVSLYGLITKFTTTQEVSTVATNRATIAQRASAIATKAWTAAQWLWNAALSANPIGLVIVGIAALIGIGYALVKNWDKVKAWFTLLWNDPAAAVHQFIDAIRNKFAGTFKWLEDKWNKLKSLFTGGGAAAASAEEAADIDIPGYASGGFTNQPAIFGEAGLEAAIPIDGSARSVSIWNKAGDMLGVGRGDTIIHATFAPVIHGAGPEIITVLKEQQKSFIEQLEDAIHQQRRVAYG